MAKKSSPKLKLPPVSTAEKKRMQEFLDRCSDQCSTTLRKFRKVPKAKRTEEFQAMITYWDHALKAFRWAKSVNGKRVTTDGTS